MAINGLGWGWRDFEELLHCPVCLDVPSRGVIEQCRTGHHICTGCRQQVDKCPLCKCEMTGTRNFIAEEVIRHLTILKNLLSLNNVDPKQKKKKRKCGPAVVTVPRQKLQTPCLNRGVYNCRVIGCDVVLPLSRLRNHVRSLHSDKLVEGTIDFQETFSHTWAITANNNKGMIAQHQFLVSVAGIGLVYLTIEVLKTGDLICYVQMASSFTTAQRFLATVTFSSSTETFTYNTQPLSVRDRMPFIMNRLACFTLLRNQLRKLYVNGKMSVTLRLRRFETDHLHILTLANRDQINLIAAKRASLEQKHCESKMPRLEITDRRVCIGK